MTNLQPVPKREVIRGDFASPVVAEFPSRVTVELTNRCNLSCTMCPRQLMQASQGYMSFGLYRKIIDEMARYPGTALIPFFRGESMLHKQFIEMLTYAKKKGIRPIQLTTNATRMTSDIARALVDLDIDFVSFSVDSIDPESYASIRRGGDLEKVTENIEYFCRYRAARGSGGTEVQVSFVRSGRNEDQIENFINHWRVRVDRVRVFEQHSEDGNFGSVETIRDRYVFERRLPCMKVFNEIAIYWNGRVALCCHDWDRRREIGNVSKSSIADVWRNDIYKHIRRTHLEDLGEMEELCQHCDQWKAYYLPQEPGAIGELYTDEPAGVGKERLTF